VGYAVDDEGEQDEKRKDESRKMTMYLYGDMGMILPK